MRAFAIGCLRFGRRDIEEADFYDKPFDFDAHNDKLRKTIESIPNIANIEIYNPQRQTMRFSDYRKGDSNYKYNFFPFIYGQRINFTINIPQRIQNGINSFRSNAGTESFDVSIRYAHDAPTTIISYEIGDDSVSPSDAVVIVRKYLEDYLLKNSQEFSFNTLGPSPFHADFYIEKAGEGEKFDGPMWIEDRSFPGVGYKNYKVKYKENIGKNDINAVDTFSDVFSESISTYYRSVLYRNDQIHLAAEAREHLNSILEMQLKTGFRGLVDRIFTAPKVNRDLMIALMHAEIKKSEGQNFLETARRNQSVLPDSLFEKFASSELKDVGSVPAIEVREIIKMFEERYLKSIENSTVIIAGLLGGLVGSVITYLVGK